MYINVQLMAINVKKNARSAWAPTERKNVQKNHEREARGKQ